MPAAGQDRHRYDRIRRTSSHPAPTRFEELRADVSAETRDAASAAVHTHPRHERASLPAPAEHDPHTILIMDEDAEPFDWTPEIDLVKGLLLPGRVQVVLDYMEACKNRLSSIGTRLNICETPSS
jgi:hypothetical protein